MESSVKESVWNAHWNDNQHNILPLHTRTHFFKLYTHSSYVKRISCEVWLSDSQPLCACDSSLNVIHHYFLVVQNFTVKPVLFWLGSKNKVQIPSVIVIKKKTKNKRVQSQLKKQWAKKKEKKKHFLNDSGYHTGTRRSKANDCRLHYNTQQPLGFLNKNGPSPAL